MIVSNHPDAEALARFHGIEFRFIPTKVGSKRSMEEAQQALLDDHGIDLVVLARYMQILSPEFVQRYPRRIINVHHSFLPAFIGARPYHAAFARGVKLIGATSHYVTEDLDDGPIIEQDVTRVSHRDQVEDLVKKGRDLERMVLSRALDLASGAPYSVLRQQDRDFRLTARNSDIVSGMNRTLIVRLSAGVFFLLAAWVAYTQNQGKQPPQLTLNKVKDDLYEIEGDGGNVAVYITNEGVILIDDKYEQDHDQIMEKVKSVTNQPIKYILSTHYHADHSGGNAKFLPHRRSSPPPIARKNIVEHVQSNAPPGSRARADHLHRGSIGVSGRQGSARALFRTRPHQRRRGHVFPRACAPSTPAT